MLVAGCWILDTGCWMPDAGCKVGVEGGGLQEFGIGNAENRKRLTAQG